MGLPVGLYIGENYAALAQVEMTKQGLRPVFYRELAYTNCAGETLSEQRNFAIRELVGQLPKREKLCVISLPADRVWTESFSVPPRANARTIEQAAMMEGDTLVSEIPMVQRAISITPTIDTTKRFLCFADRKDLSEMIAIAQEAGLTPIACDTPLAVWQRLVGGSLEQRLADGILDLSSQRPALHLFPTTNEMDIGRTLLAPPNSTIDGLVRFARAAVIAARRDDFADVRSLVIVGGAQDERNAIGTALVEMQEDLTIVPFVLNGIESPYWGVALGLAYWGALEPWQIRANLIQHDRTVLSTLREQFTSPVFINGVAGLGLAAILTLGYGTYLGRVQAGIQAQSIEVGAQIAQLGPEHARVQNILTIDQNLETIDRDALWLRQSGVILGLRLAWLGDAIPNNVWLDNLSEGPQGWALQGHGLSLPAEATMIARLGRANPGLDVRFGSITLQNNYGFDAIIAAPPPTPAPTPAASASPTPGGTQ